MTGFTDALNSLPGPLQTVVAYTSAAGGGLLSLTGQGLQSVATMGQASLALGNIMPDKVMDSKVGSLLLSGARGQSPANPMWVQPVGAGLGAPSGIPGAAGSVGGAMPPWYTRTLPGVSQLGGAPMTAGSAALGVGLGVAGAVGQYNDMTAIGADGGTAFGVAAATGITEALIASFVPGGAIAVAAAEGLRFGINQLYNVPMERDAENGLGSQLAEKATKQGPMSHAQKAADALKRAQALQEQADAINPKFGFGPWVRDEKMRQKTGLETEAEGQRVRWATESKLGRKEDNASPAIERAANFEALKQRAIEQNRFNPGQDSGIISNSPFRSKNEGAADGYDALSPMQPRARCQRQPEVQSVAPEDGGWTTVVFDQKPISHAKTPLQPPQFLG